MARPTHAALVAVGLWALAAGCSEPAKSPEDAYLRLLTACEKGDAAFLFDALDTPTQWSIESVHSYQREMRELILADYPPGDRERALSRIPAAAEEEGRHARRYFRRLEGTAERLAEIKRRMFLGTGQPVGATRVNEGTADVWREGGTVFHFARDPVGRWGFSELHEEWESAKLRANHDVDTVRANAELYRQRARAEAKVK
jgi:hypothetical protein